jgi:hypothetical protein
VIGRSVRKVRRGIRRVKKVIRRIRKGVGSSEIGRGVIRRVGREVG